MRSGILKLDVVIAMKCMKMLFPLVCINYKNCLVVKVKQLTYKNANYAKELAISNTKKIPGAATTPTETKNGKQ